MSRKVIVPAKTLCYMVKENGHIFREITKEKVVYDEDNDGGSEFDKAFVIKSWATNKDLYEYAGGAGVHVFRLPDNERKIKLILIKVELVEYPE